MIIKKLSFPRKSEIKIQSSLPDGLILGYFYALSVNFWVWLLSYKSNFIQNLLISQHLKYFSLIFLFLA